MRAKGNVITVNCKRYGTRMLNGTGGPELESACSFLFDSICSECITEAELRDYRKEINHKI